LVFFENFRVAVSSLRANLMRSMLTALGIIIGVAAVIAVVSIVQGLQYMITQEVQGVGATYMQVSIDWQQQNPGLVSRQVKLTWDDGKAIREEVPGIRQITPIIGGNVQIKYRDRTHSPIVLGVTADYPDVVNHTVDRGRFISRIDTEHRRKVAVVGEEVVDELKLGDPIGKEIYVGNTAMTVIGVMEDKGQALGQNRNDMIFVPFDAALTLFGRNAGDRVELHLQAENAVVIDEVKDGIQRVLRQRHKIASGAEDDFRVVKQDELLDFFGRILGSVTAVVGGVVGIALLVGGIGIMNIMLVSVTERTREIGVRKAVGARRQDVLVQFLIEAVTLSLVGGALGLALGYGMGALVSSILPGNFPPAHVPLWAVILAFGFSAAVGIFFGIYPAAKASRLDPIDALRYE
jgi:putative ABC transport system permease protein